LFGGLWRYRAVGWKHGDGTQDGGCCQYDGYGSVHVIIGLPTPVEVTNPALLTVANDALLLVQAQALLILAVLLSE